MKHFVMITPDGQFALEGRRWYCNSVIYFGHHPGAMRNWFTDESWAINAPLLDRDFGQMAALGVNHAALFLTNEMFFDAGRPVSQGYDRLDQVVATAKKHGIRVTLFCGPFIDNEAEYFRVTGRRWEHDNRWLPSFNPALFDAYVTQVKGLALRYRNEPAVLGYTDRIDRFYKGFDNVSIPFNLKEEWAAHLRRKFGTMAELRVAMRGNLEGDPKDFHELLLPQESKLNGSLHNPSVTSTSSGRNKPSAIPRHGGIRPSASSRPIKSCGHPSRATRIRGRCWTGFRPRRRCFTPSGWSTTTSRSRASAPSSRSRNGCTRPRSSTAAWPMSCLCCTTPPT